MYIYIHAYGPTINVKRGFELKKSKKGHLVSIGRRKRKQKIM